MRLPPSAKIIVVDDSESMVIGVRRALVQLGFPNVIEATNGDEGFAALNAHPDTALVISDWNMEPTDGLALLANVRNDPRFQKLPFILMSADASPYMRERAGKLDVSLVLAKPFDAQKLADAIAELP